MLPAKLRLRGGEARRVRGNEVRSPFLRVFRAPRAKESGRYLIVVASGVSKSSARRHLIKRRIRAFVQNRAQHPYDTVIVALPPSKDLSAQELKENLAKLLK